MTLTHRLDVFSNGEVEEQGVTLPTDRLFWRVLHWIECGDPKRSRPEVNPLFPNHHTPFTKEWQLFSYAFDGLGGKWTAVYSYQRAFTNDQGFGDPDDPRANYVVGKDLSFPLPKVEALICGGALVAGKVSGSDLIIETLNGRHAPPSVEWLRAHPWLYFDAVNCDAGGVPRLFPQGRGSRVLIPLIADRDRFPLVTIPLSRVVRWTGSMPPDPYKIYLNQGTP